MNFIYPQNQFYSLRYLSLTCFISYVLKSCFKKISHFVHWLILYFILNFPPFLILRRTNSKKNSGRYYEIQESGFNFWGDSLRTIASQKFISSSKKFFVFSFIKSLDCSSNKKSLGGQFYD